MINQRIKIKHKLVGFTSAGSLQYVTHWTLHVDLCFRSLVVTDTTLKSNRPLTSSCHTWQLHLQLTAGISWICIQFKAIFYIIAWCLQRNDLLTKEVKHPTSASRHREKDNHSLTVTFPFHHLSFLLFVRANPYIYHDTLCTIQKSHRINRFECFFFFFIIILFESFNWNFFNLSCPTILRVWAL